MLGNFSSFFCCLQILFQTFQKILSGILSGTISEGQTVLIQNKPVLGLIWVQPVCKIISRQQNLQQNLSLAGKDLSMISKLFLSLNLKICLCTQRTNCFKYCTCPAGRVTYNFHSPCKHMHLSLKGYAIKNRVHTGKFG